MVHAFAAPETGENFRLFIPTLGWDDERDVLADGFLCRMAK
jgi:hypothetical protein